MASILAVLLLLFAGLCTLGFGDDCQAYYDIHNNYKPSKSCFWQYCCGTCDQRYCCSVEILKLSDNAQTFCNLGNVGITLIVVAVVVFITLFITCCVCPCCCIYKMCRKPRPVVGAHVTTVMNTNVIQQQPVMQGGQCPQYQPVPAQPGYGGQPMQTGPYQGQLYAPGPPPSYHVATSPGYPGSQSAYDGSQAMYPMQPPAQPGVIYMPSETTNQPAYNPAYVQPPNIGY